MNLLPEQKEILRRNLLEQLEAAKPMGMNANSLSYGLRIGGFKLNADDTAAELDYLESKGLVKMAAATLSAGVKLYKITAAGTELLEDGI